MEPLPLLPLVEYNQQQKNSQHLKTNKQTEKQADQNQGIMLIA